MTAKTILQFQFGQAEAIRRVAASKSALVTGTTLVLLTAIARNYDQTFIQEKPFLWLFGPLLFSFGSATLVFSLVYPVFIRRHLVEPRPDFASQFLSFLGLFWMTAPIAWLYAIPVERFLDSYSAAKANLALLAIVALWRVCLLARVFSVIQETPFWRALMWVLIPACLEVMALYFFGGGFAQAIMAGMAGMRNSPEENLLLNAMAVSATAAFWICVVTMILAAFFREQATLQTFPLRQPGQLPRMALTLLAVIWIGISIYPQIQVRRNMQVDRLVKAEKYKEALQFLSAHHPSNFAPARELPPKRYEYELFEKLPKLLQAMDGSEAEWVRRYYLRSSDILLDHGIYHGDTEEIPIFLNGLRKMPDGRAWLQTNAAEFDQEIQRFKGSDTNLLLLWESTVTELQLNANASTNGGSSLMQHR